VSTLEKDKDRIYLVRDEGLGPEVVAGPIPAYDDSQQESLLISFLRDHPWDETIQYYCLLIDRKGAPSLEEFLPDHLEYLMAQAWGIDMEEEAEYGDDEKYAPDQPPEPPTSWEDEGGSISGDERLRLMTDSSIYD
jgi:hypothetical protein